MADIMKVEQAVFASSDRGSVKGYQLVAKSGGVDRACSQALCRWAPTQFPSDDPDHWTINYFPLSDDLVAVTRTVLGGPEYSGRGGTQVVTLILVLANEQFLSYGCNPIAVARTAMTMGSLKLPLDMAREQLPQATLPSRPIVEPSLMGNRESDDDGFSQLLKEVTDLLRDGRRVAVVGLSDPMEAVVRLLPRLSHEARRSFSFTTGLAPAASRPFQAHFLSDVDLTRQRTLVSQNIVRVDASSAATL